MKDVSVVPKNIVGGHNFWDNTDSVISIINKLSYATDILYGLYYQFWQIIIAFCTLKYAIFTYFIFWKLKYVSKNYWKFKLISHILLFQIFLRKKETKCIFKIIFIFFRANSLLWKGKEDMIRTILKSGNLRQKTVSCRFSTSLRMSSRLLKQDEAIAIDQELFNE